MQDHVCAICGKKFDAMFLNCPPLWGVCEVSMSLLHDIQQKLAAPKDKRNDFGKYNYRSKESILEAVKPLLKDRGTVLITDEVVAVGDRVYVKSTATLAPLDGEGPWSACGWAQHAANRTGMDESQLTGATSSYAGKYALGNLFAIDDTKDSDATNDHGRSEPQAAPPKPKPKGPPLNTVEDCLAYIKRYCQLSPKSTAQDREATFKEARSYIAAFYKSCNEFDQTRIAGEMAAARAALNLDEDGVAK